MKIKKFAIFGANKGNGHPYSFSAIINGYNAKQLNKYCEYDTIKKYLKNRKLPEKKFKNYKVNFIYTQNLKLSKKISNSCKIPNIITKMNHLPKNINGIILARDDFKLNDFLISYCLKNKISIFLDKQISKDIRFLNKNKKKIIKFGRIFGGSGVSYCDEFLKFKSEYKKNKFKILKIICTSKGKWLNYGQHLLDPLFDLFNFKHLDFICSKRVKNTKILETKISKISCKLILKDSGYKDIKMEFYTNKGKKSVIFNNPYNAFSKMLINYLKKYNKINKKGIKKLFMISENILQGQKIIDKK